MKYKTAFMLAILLVSCVIKLVQLDVFLNFGISSKSVQESVCAVKKLSLIKLNSICICLCVFK